MSSLERCPLFRVSFVERFHYITQCAYERVCLFSIQKSVFYIVKHVDTSAVYFVLTDSYCLLLTVDRDVEPVSDNPCVGRECEGRGGVLEKERGVREGEWCERRGGV